MPRARIAASPWVEMTDERRPEETPNLPVPVPPAPLEEAQPRWERPERRTYTAEYKQRILKELDAATEQGHIGAILRREGLYNSIIAQWRQQRELAELEGLSAKKRGRKASPEAREISRLERENRKLQEQLRRAQLVIDIQKKASELLGIPLETPDDESSFS